MGETRAPEEEALRWLVRLDSDTATGEDWSALTEWLKTSPTHLAAFEAAETLMADIEAAAPALRMMVAKTSGRVIPLRWARVLAPVGSVQALAAAAIVTMTAIGFGGWQAARGPLQVFGTRAGETREVALADGSHVRLDSATTLSVRLGWFGRAAKLGAGQATFDIAHSPARPFDVDVADERVRVVGTEFNISNYDGVVDVAVRRGAVAVTAPGPLGASVKRVPAGWDFSRHVGGRPAVPRRSDPENAFAWTEGRLICDRRPVSEIVAYLNRRYTTPIRLSSTAAGLKFSGVLVLGDQDELVRHLAAYLSLKARRADGEFHLE